MAKTAQKKLKGKVTDSNNENGSAVVKNKTKERKREEKLQENCAKKGSTHLQGNKTQDKQSVQRNECESPCTEDEKAVVVVVGFEDDQQLSAQSGEKSRKRKFACEEFTVGDLSSSSQNSKKKKKKQKLDVNPVTEIEEDDKMPSQSNAKLVEESACSSSDAGRTTSTKPSTKKQSAGSKNKKVFKRSKNENEQDNVSETNQTQQTDSSAKYHALQYLRRWKNHCDEWSFQKVRQVWLLQNMYEETKVLPLLSIRIVYIITSRH